MRPLSERLEEILSSVKDRPITVAEKAELLMLLREAAELARSFEAAPISITEHVESNSGSFVAAECDWLMDGKRVRIVPEKEGL